jgi:curved DNA-binding protein CbpA
MAYFKKLEDLDALKAEYRRLALENHPDRGGNLEIMQAINVEFEVAYRILKLRDSDPSKITSDGETAATFRQQFYTQNGWAGFRFNALLPLKEIAKIVRGYVKDVYPTWRFSVTTHYASMCQELKVAVMEAPMDIFDQAKILEAAKDSAWRDPWHKEVEYHYERFYKEAYERGYVQTWKLCKWFTESAQAVLDDVRALVQSYNRKDCDAMIDYFDVHFYDSFDIGKWDKPFRVVQRTARIAPSQARPDAKRITG